MVTAKAPEDSGAGTSADEPIMVRAFGFDQLGKVAELMTRIIDMSGDVRTPADVFAAMTIHAPTCEELIALSARVPVERLKRVSAIDGIRLIVEMYEMNAELLQVELPKLVRMAVQSAIQIQAARKTGAELQAFIAPATGGH